MDTTYVQILNQNQSNWWEFVFRILPVMTLILGLLLNHWYKRFTERKQRKDTKKYLLYSIDTLRIASRKQSVYISDLITQLEKNPTDVPLLNLAVGFHLKNLDILAKNQLFDIFVLKKHGDKSYNSEKLNKYNDSLELIRTLMQHFIDEIERLRNIDDEAKLKYNSYFAELKDIINKKTLRVNTPITEQMFLKNPNILTDNEKDKKIREEVDHVFMIFFSKPDLEKNLFNHFEYIVKPIFEIAKNNNDYELLSFIPPCIEHCQGYFDTRISFTIRFRSLNENLNKAILNLDEVYNFVKL